MKKKVLFIRLDKIGDLICSLPIDESSFLQDVESEWVIAKGLAFVADHATPQRKYLELDKGNSKESSIKLLAFLKQWQPDLAISLQAPWWVHWCLFKAGIPLRVGVYSQWHSFLFLTHGVRQKRSLAEKHEADYNQEILNKGWELLTKIPVDIKTATPVLKMKSKNAEITLEKFDLFSGHYTVVHPGMAGSALNWPLEKYKEWIAEVLEDSNDPIVITGTPLDEFWIKPLREHFQNESRVRILQNQLNTEQLLGVLAHARLVLAPSTGVMHLAASLGTKTFGIFSPIRVQRALRWQARGPHVKIFASTANCAEQFHCIKEKCPHYNCMEKINVDTYCSL